MGNIHDRILIVEHNPEISDLIGRQTLQSIGYQVQIVGDATSAIPRISQFAPDVIIVDLNLPGLSGKDLLLALISQGIETPVILVAKKGQEGEAIQTFRLGASDYLLWPARETEVAAVVERVLNKVNQQRSQEQLARQLKRTNLDLQTRVRELTAILSTSMSLISIGDRDELLNRAVEAGIRITGAELGWMLLQEAAGESYILVAQRNCPPQLASRLNQPWEDGISTLVSMSGEPLSIYGDALKRFKISGLGQSVLIVPVKIQRQTNGLLAVMRKTATPFKDSEQHLLAAVADYTSMGLINVRLLGMQIEQTSSLEEVQANSQAAEKTRNEMLKALALELNEIQGSTRVALDHLNERLRNKIPSDIRDALTSLTAGAQKSVKVSNLIASIAQTEAPSQPASYNLVELAQQELPRLKQFAQDKKISLVAELSPDPIPVRADPILLAQVLDGLVSRAVKANSPGGLVVLRVENIKEENAHVTVRDNCPEIGSRDLSQLFERTTLQGDRSNTDPGCEHLSLALVNDMITQSGGKVWAESKPGLGLIYHFTLPTSSLLNGKDGSKN